MLLIFHESILNGSARVGGTRARQEATLYQARQQNPGAHGHRDIIRSAFIDRTEHHGCPFPSISGLGEYQKRQFDLKVTHDF